MTNPIVILIAAPDVVPALRERLQADSQVVTFADSDPVRAMRAIIAHRPAIIALERLFAASPRGAALITRIKSDPSLDESEIRILSHNSSYQRVSPRRRGALPKATTAKPARSLDPGTRRAPRFPMKESTQAQVDGQASQLVNLSVLGAQLIAPGAIRPKRGITVTLGPPRKPVVVAGTVVWARAELSRTGPVSRIGVEFNDPDQQAVEAFLDAHRRG
jgi:PilZ domain